MSEPNPSAHDVAHDPNYVYCNPVAGGCGKQKKHDKFRVGAGICLACEEKSRREESEVRELATQQKAAQREFGRMLLEAERRKRLNLPALSEAVTGLIQKFGGMEAWLTDFHRNIAAGEEGSKTVLDAHHRMMTMLAAANAQEVVRDVHSMDDAELTVLLGQFAMEANAQVIDAEAKRIEQQDADD